MFCFGHPEFYSLAALQVEEEDGVVGVDSEVATNRATLVDLNEVVVTEEDDPGRMAAVVEVSPLFHTNTVFNQIESLGLPSISLGCRFLHWG